MGTGAAAVTIASNTAVGGLPFTVNSSGSATTTRLTFGNANNQFKGYYMVSCISNDGLSSGNTFYVPTSPAMLCNGPCAVLSKNTPSGNSVCYWSQAGGGFYAPNQAIACGIVNITGAAATFSVPLIGESTSSSNFDVWITEVSSLISAEKIVSDADQIKALQDDMKKLHAQLGFKKACEPEDECSLSPDTPGSEVDYKRQFDVTGRYVGDLPVGRSSSRK